MKNIKRVLLAFSILSLTLANLNLADARPVSISQNKSQIIRTATLDGYLFTFYFDSSSNKLDNVTIDGATVLSFYNDSINYNASTDTYEIVFFKVRYQVGSSPYARVFGSVTL